MTRAFALTLSLLTAFPAWSQEFVPVTDEAEFRALVTGKDLRIGLYNLTIRLGEDGTIAGSAMGWRITGKWRWEEGYFCRDMDWSGMAIPENCQLVEIKGGDTVRFTVDRGAGDTASLKIR